MKKHVIILYLLQQFAFNSLAQNNVFVSTTGSDVTGIGSISSPFKTAAKAVQSNLLTPGSNLYFRGGTYTNPGFQNGDIWKVEETVFINGIYGTSSQYINIKPYNNEQVIIRGDGDMIFQFRNSSYLKISGFEIYGETDNITLSDALYHQFEFKRTSLSNPVELRCPRNTNTDQSGLEDLTPYTIYRPTLYNGHGMVIQNSHHVEVFNNLIHHVPGEGMRFAGCDYLKIYNNEIHNCARRSSGGVHGISGYNQRSIDNVDAVKTFISKNLVHDNYQELFSWTESKTIVTAIIDEGKGITLQRINGGNEWLHGRIQIDNNITYRNGFSGVHVNDGLRVDIINNTSYMNCKSNRGTNIGISVQTGNDVKIYNNMVFTDLSFGGYSIGGSNLMSISMSNNLINGNLDPDYTGIAVNTYINSNFKWVDTLNRNFNLQATSPAIGNALIAVTPATDFYNKQRDAAPDLGAVEYIASLSTIIVNFNATIQQNNSKLTFELANENFATVVIERSDNCFSSWQKIAEVQGNNNKKYTFIDTKVVRECNYYRLRIIDKDGNVIYSKVAFVNFGNNNNIAAYPNPFTNSVFVISSEEIKEYQLKTITGINLLSNVNFSINGSSMQINTSQLSSGVYLLTINNKTILIKK